MNMNTPTHPLHLLVAGEGSRYAMTDILYTGQHALATDGRRLIIRPDPSPEGIVSSEAIRRCFDRDGAPRGSIAAVRRLDDGRTEIEYRSGAKWTSPPTKVTKEKWPPAAKSLPAPGAAFDFVACFSAPYLYEIWQALCAGEAYGVSLWRERGKPVEGTPIVVTSTSYFHPGACLLMPVGTGPDDREAERARLSKLMESLHSDPGIPGREQPDAK